MPPQHMDGTVGPQPRFSAELPAQRTFPETYPSGGRVARDTPRDASERKDIACVGAERLRRRREHPACAHLLFADELLRPWRVPLVLMRED